jgi:hypothetical protein
MQVEHLRYQRDHAIVPRGVDGIGEGDEDIVRRPRVLTARIASQ